MNSISGELRTEIMPPKRKSAPAEEAEAPRRSTRQRTSAAHEPAPPPPKKTAKAPAKAKAAVSKKKADEQQEKPSKGKIAKASEPKKAAKASSEAKPVANGSSADGEKNYWLLKAEPESRLENGIDVKFSIDDLAAKTEPEPWDGIRNYVARNNLRAMKKGELAFFYHSNCKEPGIAGTMEIVQEHSPDLSAHDPKAPYYDANSKPSDPKWSVVHVKFRSKFAVPITLKELREMGGAGKPLENMQMLKQSRLSVSKVSASEWEYLVGVAEEKAKKAS